MQQIIDIIKLGFYAIIKMFEAINQQPILQLIVYVPLGLAISGIIIDIIKRIKRKRR